LHLEVIQLKEQVQAKGSDGRLRQIESELNDVMFLTG